MEEKLQVERLVKDSAQKAVIKLPKNKKIRSVNHKIKKRAVRLARLQEKGNEIYVRHKSNSNALIAYCKKQLDSDAQEFKIHGLGNTCNKAIDIARRLIEKYPGTYDLDIKSEPTTLIDDLEPINDEADYEIQETSSIAVHIRIFPIAKIGPLRFDKI